MSYLALNDAEGLNYRHQPPADDTGLTFVFVNALTGSLDVWEGAIGEALRQAGHGTLSYNLRGQADSPLGAETTLDEALIVSDLRALLKEVAPPNPVLVGLSIGGLFAAKAILQGERAAGLVLLNTLRVPTLRLDWINRSMVRAAEVGGMALVMDCFLPHLVGPEMLARLRGERLTEAPYEPIDTTSGAYRLLKSGIAANWELPYEELDLPTLVVTGRQDRVFLVEADVAALSARLPRAERVDLDPIGHLIPMEAPEETARLLLDFAAKARPC